MQQCVWPISVICGPTDQKTDRFDAHHLIISTPTLILYSTTTRSPDKPISGGENADDDDDDGHDEGRGQGG